MIPPVFTNWISAQVSARLRDLPESVALRWFLLPPTRTVLLAWTRTDGKYLALKRFEETTLTRQLVGLKFSLKKWAVKSSSSQPSLTSNTSRRVVGQWGGAGGAICEDHFALARAI